MDAARLTDQACERVLAGRLNAGDEDLQPLRWLLEDVKSLFGGSVPRAAHAMHPAAVTRHPSTAPRLEQGTARSCKPERIWWTGG